MITFKESVLDKPDLCDPQATIVVIAYKELNCPPEKRRTRITRFDNGLPLEELREIAERDLRQEFGPVTIEREVGYREN